MAESIPLEKCKNRVLYRIHSRNLGFGVFNEADNGFVGIREKFGVEYLFTEYHWDTGEPFGTVHPVEELEPLPEDIDIRESLGTVDEETGKPLVFDKPRAEGGKGWHFADGTVTDDKVMPMSVSNKKLFQWLDEKRKQYRGV